MLSSDSRSLNTLADEFNMETVSKTTLILDFDCMLKVKYFVKYTKRF